MKTIKDGKASKLKKKESKTEKYIKKLIFHIKVGFLHFENKGMGCDELRMAKPTKWNLKPSPKIRFFIKL